MFVFTNTNRHILQLGGKLYQMFRKQKFLNLIFHTLYIKFNETSENSDVRNRDKHNTVRHDYSNLLMMNYGL